MDFELNLTIEQLDSAKGLPLPSYQTIGSSGMDLYASNTEDIIIEPMGTVLVPIGIKLHIPWGYEVQIRARSSLALKYGLILPNAPGTIDSDYRGELKVIISNIGKEPFVVKRGERIAQMVVCKVAIANVVEGDVMLDTERGEGGFGSTGR